MIEIASIIDHTILKPDTSLEQVKEICNEAREYGFASVCVNPYYVKYVSDSLKGTDVKTTSVVGFPLGSTRSDVKALETEMAIEDGADEIDMVINISALKDRKLDIVREDIRAVVKASRDNIVKVIIEACLLTEEEKIIACEISNIFITAVTIPASPNPSFSPYIKPLQLPTLVAILGFLAANPSNIVSG